MTQQLEIHELLDRFEILYPDISEIADLRRAVVDQDLSSIFRLAGEGSEELRKAVMEDNMHSLFRVMQEQSFYDVDELYDHLENVRKAVVNKNLRNIFRLIDNEDLAKLIIDQNMWKLSPALEKYIDTQFLYAFKTFFANDIEFDKDCFSRGQLQSKLWLIRELEKLPVDLGTVFLCAGWYGTLATMLFESNIKLDKVRSFDIDPLCAPIAEIFNKPWVMEGWQFKAATQDIMDIDYREHHYTVSRSDGSTCDLRDFPDTVINTSMEHIPNYSEWWRSIPKGKLMIVQCNDYEDLEEHVSTASSLDEFDKMTPVVSTLFLGELKLEKYSRFMKIGYK